MNTRYYDKLWSVEDINNPCLVVCPKCGHCAVVVIDDENTRGRFSPRKLYCKHCPHRDRWASAALSNLWRNEAKDDYFNLPLWLQVSFGKNILYAYNEEHLSFLEDYAAAVLRQRQRHPEYGWANQSAVSRLPKWFKSGKNRSQIVKGLQRLRARAVNC